MRLPPFISTALVVSKNTSLFAVPSRRPTPLDIAEVHRWDSLTIKRFVF